MNNTIDQQFIEYIVKSLVGNPDDVKLARTIDEKGVLLELTVNPEDLGRVIGKRGATAQSLRTLLRALGTKNDARYNLKIVDNGDGENRRSHESSEPEAPAAAPVAQVEEPAAAAEEDDFVTSLDEEVSEDKEDDSEDRLSKTRRELADLDDLDV